MKLAGRILVTALFVALAVAPAAPAKPGGGHGKGGGKPAWAGGAKGAEKSKAAKEHKAKKDKQAKQSAKAAKAGKAKQEAAAAAGCEDGAGTAADLLGELFGASECGAEAQATEPTELEGLGPGQYCHTLGAWVAENGGNFAETFGTEGSGFANAHGKCASRRAHAEDLLPVAQEALPEEETTEEAAAPEGSATEGGSLEVTALARFLRL